MKQPVILIDGFSLVFRAYHALLYTGMQTHTGEPTFAVLSFANMISYLLETYKPEAIAVAFDTAAPTFRHEAFPEYKAHRDAFPDDLVPQLARIKTFLDLLGIPRIEMQGYEADDVIGTLAVQQADQGNSVLCVTSDKDYFQLVNDKIHVLRPGKDSYDVYEPATVREKFGVPPHQVADVLALMGDSSDNVPGVKGIGEKTALPLIKEYGTLETLYDALETVQRASVRKKLEESRSMAFLSKHLVTIDTRVPLQPESVHVRRTSPDYVGLDSLFEELGFTSLRSKYRTLAAGEGANRSNEIHNPGTDGFGSNQGPVHVSHTLQTLSDVEHSYTLVDTYEALDSMLNEFGTPDWLSVDLETTGLDAMQCRIVGIALCVTPGTSYYINVNDVDEQQTSPALFDTEVGTDGLPITAVINKLKILFHNPKVGKVGQNLKYDALVLRRYGITLEPFAFDSMLASYILDPDLPHNMDALAERLLQYKTIPITALIGEKRSSQKNMRDVDPTQVRDYAAEDADVALKLSLALRTELQNQGLETLAQTVEFPTAEVLVQIEYNGVFINKGALADLGEYMRAEAARLEQEIYTEAGEKFTINSPKQLGEILFDRMMLPGKKRNKTGYSTDVSVLTELAESYPIAQLVLDYRQVEKLRNTYVETLPKLIKSNTGRVHTSFNQTVAATGRLSSTDPNLQNIPVRTELGQQIRKAFVAQHPDHVIMSADYSQIELRIMAAMSQDANLLAAFKHGEDIHKATAAILFDVPIDAVTTEQRRIAKTTNFGIMYGQGAFGLSQRLGTSRQEAQEIIANYFAKYPGIRGFIDDTIRSTRERGYTTTLLGRRRYFPLINSNNKNLAAGAARACINTPIQGSASDMMKLAMIAVHRTMKQQGFKALMILQVHDELLFEVHRSEVDELRTMVQTTMEQAMPLHNVPVVVETGVGESWYQAH